MMLTSENNQQSDFEREVGECLRIAIVHNLTDNIVRVGYKVTGERVYLIFGLAQFPTDRECDCISEIEGEMYAYLPESLKLDSLIFLAGEENGSKRPMLVITAE